eukprot:CAMPEP_0113682856 /NCGR_PEP_ID=MMETSP0038_2-20120614/12921_1 /TAXON_ID=2898 /ORGANISM="Cryptomonas paramecium" /LENGTH=440 /DNA_ID=CAMNT_0000602023 /DNA_START=98 /DNA_END=1416 /DNA_ORIENTATION=- /assembly_acc=CAM_ASM_000170
MAEMSFGPRMRPARGFDKKDNYLGIPGLTDPFQFLQCVVSRPPELDYGPAVVEFPNHPAKMLAVVLPDYGPPTNMKVQLCDLPKLPGGKLRPNEVLVEIHASSVNPTDWKQRKGTLSSLCRLTLPTILGIDFSGRVVRAGDEAQFAYGEEVFGRQTIDRMREVNGTYAEYCVVDSADIFRKPLNLTHDEAAAVPQACLAAFAALSRVGRLHSGADNHDKSVLILGGSGGVGSFAIQLARHHFGCGHVVASCSARNADLVQSLGAHVALDYTQPNFLRSQTARRLYNVVVDCVGGDDYWQAVRALLAPPGSGGSACGVYVTLVGSQRYLGGEAALDIAGALQIRADYLVRQFSHQIGAAEGYHILTGSQVRSEDLSEVARLLELGKIRPVLARVLPLYQVVQAHEISESHHAVGKLVLQVKRGPAREEDSRGTAAASAAAA